MAVLVKRTGYLKYRTVGKSKPMRAINTHLKYIEQQKEKHRNKVQLFSQDKDRVERREFYDRIKDQKPHGVVAHKLVISLSEDERNRTGVDLKELVRDTMAQYEAKCKQQLDWIAAIHDDEGHPHCHIVIRGRDLDGKSVFIDTRRMRQMEKIADRVKERFRERKLERGWDRQEEKDLFRQLEQERIEYPQKREYRQIAKEWER
jgi:type IV secretory pathway VirD2 relaxase